jgi:predicted O-methyltransferase YrrM
MDFPDLARLASGHVEARIVQAAIQLGVFDCLKKPTTVSAVASSLGTEPRATELLAYALVAIGLLQENHDRFSLAPVALKYLVKDSPQYYGDMILFDASLWSCWERLEDAVKSGRPVRPADMYQQNPEETERFIRAMDSLVQARGDAVHLARDIGWHRVKKLLDIGSGPGTYPIYLCRQFPEIHATVFDLPDTLKITEKFVRQAGLQERFNLVAGDYRTDTISGHYDVIFLSNIIHGESFQENERLIGKVAANLETEGRIIIKDHVLDRSRTHPPVGAIFSLLMLLTTESGRCYTFEEVKCWLEKAGLKRVRQIDLPPPLTSALVIGEK